MGQRQKRDPGFGAELVAGYRASGQSRRGYCAAAGVPVTTLDYYLHRERRAATAAPPRWLPLHVLPEPAGGGLVVVLRAGIRVEVGCGFDERTLARLVAVLGGV